jgi:hypothetical protein
VHEGYPDLIHRGDFLKDNYQQLATEIAAIDPSKQCTIVITAGTPCPDFSVVTDRKAGTPLPEGNKFVQFANRLGNLKELLQGRKLIVMAENVIMNDPADCTYMSKRLGAEPVVFDSADSSLVSRPRLWWLNIDWKEVKVHPLTNGKIQWSQHNGHRQVRLGLPKQEPSHMEMGGLQFHADVAENKRKIHCFTTPAPDECGRAPPARPKLRTSEGAVQRLIDLGNAHMALPGPGSCPSGAALQRHVGALAHVPVIGTPRKGAQAPRPRSTQPRPALTGNQCWRNSWQTEPRGEWKAHCRPPVNGASSSSQCRAWS